MHGSNVSKRMPLLAAFLFAAVTACGGDDPPTGPGGGGGGGGGATPIPTTNVDVEDNAFDPDFILVSPGDTVTFTFVGSNQHNVNFANGSITDIGDNTSGSFTTVMPMTGGDYDFQCTRHPGTMTGTVRVS